MMRACRLCLLILSAAALGAQDAASIAALEQRAGGRLGVMALDTGTGATLSHRADYYCGSKASLADREAVLAEILNTDLDHL